MVRECTANAAVGKTMIDEIMDQYNKIRDIRRIGKPHPYWAPLRVNLRPNKGGACPPMSPKWHLLPSQLSEIGGQDFGGEALNFLRRRRRFRKFWGNYATFLKICPKFCFPNPKMLRGQVCLIQAKLGGGGIAPPPAPVKPVPGGEGVKSPVLRNSPKIHIVLRLMIRITIALFEFRENWIPPYFS